MRLFTLLALVFTISALGALVTRATIKRGPCWSLGAGRWLKPAGHGRCLPCGQLILCGSLLALLTLWVSQTAWVTAVDSWLNQALTWLRAPWVLTVADDVLRRLGGGDARRWVPVGLAVILLVTRHWVYIPGLILTTLATEYSVDWLKHIVARPRPEFLTEATSSSPSFPSRHTAGAVVVFGQAAYLAAQFWPRWRGIWVYLAWVGVISLGLARLLLSVHYLTDVMAGMLLAHCCLLLGIGLNAMIKTWQAGRAEGPAGRD